MINACISSTPSFRRGLRYFGPNSGKSYLIFIHNLSSWSKQRLMEFLRIKLQLFKEIIQSVSKKYSPSLGIYFIIKINGSSALNAMLFLLILANKLPISSKISWKFIEKLRCNRQYKKSRSVKASVGPISQDFFSSHLKPNAPFFNLCITWNINGWNTEKKDGVMYFLSIFKPVCICLQEIGNSQFLCGNKLASPQLPNYSPVYRRANPKVPGMRGLYIGVHKSCSFSPEPLLYKYIISVTIPSFWSQRCTVGNIYFPQTRWAEARLTAFDELDKWLNAHNKNNHPAVLVGDFNMSSQKIKSYIAQHYPDWVVSELIGNEYTWAKGTRSSCIDHIIYNRAMSVHINKTSVCSSFFDISDHKPILVSCHNDSNDGFQKPRKTFKWSRHICNTKSTNILSHNLFSVLADELESQNNLSADDMVHKFIETSNTVGKELKAIVPANLKGPAFHCPQYIKNLSHEKHMAYKNIKPLSESENIDSYLNQFSAFNSLCTTIKKVKSKLRSNLYKANIISVGKHFFEKSFRLGWRGLKKLAKPNFSVSRNTIIKDKNGQDILSPSDQLNRWAEHYEELASDVTGHSLNRSYWERVLCSIHHNELTWDINGPISLNEIKDTVLSMKNNKAPGPDGIPIEFYKAFFCSKDLEEEHPSAGKCLEIIFNKIWNGSFPKNWNSASIVSIPKKGDLSNCNNYRGISLINVGLKIITKIITNRISKYAFSHNFIRPEQFGFRNREECISLFISIREICQRRKFRGKFTYIAFLDLKKAYDSVPIFNILTKLYRLGIRGKSFDFLYNLYSTSKARARYLEMLSNEFPINRGVRQGCPLSPILFNLFINDVLNKCEKYGVSIGNKRCCGGLFADDIVLVAPSKKNLQKMLSSVLNWANTNEMSFGINKCATMVIKPIDFSRPPNYIDPTFYLGMYSIPKVTCYTYLGIPFDEDLSLKPILSTMYMKVQKSLFSFRSFLTNNSIPIGLKKIIIQSYIISKVAYYAPLLGSNKNRTARVQSLINTSLYWCINSYSSRSKCSNDSSKVKYEKNPYISLYALSRDLKIAPLAGVCAAQQVKCFVKWRKSNCIIKDLIRSIPPMSHYSWTKESRSLQKKLIKKNIKDIKSIKEDYWINSPLNNGSKALSYTNNQYRNSNRITLIGFLKPHLNLGITWIIRIRCGFENSTRIAIASNRVTTDCPHYCPCCGHGEQSFIHWILECSALNKYRTESLDFLNEIYTLFRNKYNNLFVTHLLPETEVNKIIYNYTYSFLLGGTLAYNELQIDMAEQRQLDEQLYSSSGSHVPYVEGLAAFLTKSIPIISSSMKLLFDRFSKTPNVIKSVDVVPIWHRNSLSVPYTESNVRNESNDNINDSWESLVEDTTLSYLMLLLFFIMFNN